MHVCFLAHIVQLLLTYEEPAADEEMEVDEGSDKGSEAGDGPWLISMMAHCRSLANIPQVKAHPQTLLDYVKENRFVNLENCLEPHCCCMSRSYYYMSTDVYANLQ